VQHIHSPAALVGKSASEMTYIVSSGALNSTHSLWLVSKVARSKCLKMTVTVQELQEIRGKMT